MHTIKTILFSIIVLSSPFLLAQDIHWTMYDMSPLTLNPANTGAYEGTYRVGGIYRDQFNNISDATGFRTPSAYIDSPIARGLNRNDWVGIGAILYNDQAGSGKLSTFGSFASVAYHKSLNTKATTQLTFGLQVGVIQRRFDPFSNGITFEDEILAGGQITSPDRDLIEDNKPFFDVNAGIALNSKLNDNIYARVGIAANHIIQPKYNLLSSHEEKLPMRIAAHGTLNFRFLESWHFTPSFLFNNFQKLNLGVFQSTIGYQFSDHLICSVGLGYRLDDAIAPILRVDYKYFRFGVSYDMTISELSDINNNQGGFEIGVSYIIRKYKSTEVRPILFCPHF